MPDIEARARPLGVFSHFRILDDFFQTILVYAVIGAMAGQYVA
jgi:hypothetical protein